MNSKEELMKPILFMGFIWLFILTIILLLLFFSRLYLYYKYKNNLTPTKGNVREQKETKQEDNTEETKVSKKERSGYYYSGKGKLFPDDKEFVENDTWTAFLLNLYKEDKLKRMKRSDYFYKGKDKIYPFDEFFFDNVSWTTKRINKYKKEYIFNKFKKDFLRNNNQQKKSEKFSLRELKIDERRTVDE